MAFSVDNRIQSSCIDLTDWNLSRVYAKDESQFPWFILVPRLERVSDITDLSELDSIELNKEIRRLSLLVKECFQPDKLNIATLGNMVEQLHIHVVGRYKDDPYWPQSIWQPAYSNHPLSPDERNKMLSNIQPYL
jgi:diadenosine tetraphosphate (Ap4A) HIT family hydrolase